MITKIRLGCATTVLLASAAVLFSSAATAMEIQQYDKMADQDQSRYVAALIVGAEKILIYEGRRDLADQVEKLFSETPASDSGPLGVTEFASNLDRARVADVERAIKDPNAHRLEVEDAMLVTLKKNDIPLSQEFIRESGPSPRISSPSIHSRSWSFERSTK